MAIDLSSQTIDVWPEGAEEQGIARSMTMDERNKIDDSDFAWPDAPDHPKYPVHDQAHLDAAAKLIGRAPADKQDEIKARAKRIAKRKGLKLPESWEEGSAKDDSTKDRAVGTEASSPNIQVTIDGAMLAATTTSTNVIADITLHRAAGMNHDPFTGTHSHAHPAFGSQGDDEMHEHEHSHDGDADHKHSHAHTSDEKKDRSVGSIVQVSDRHVMSLPLVRIDAAKREVWGQATAEVPDSYGTIFGYYPEAWTQWRGNIREQHDPKKAVGKRVDLDCNDQERAVYVGSRVSRGAQDTWLKVEDNVLTGYSASIIPDAEYGNDPRRWPKKEYNGKEYPYLPRYTVAELSLVDNPACPGCNIQIVRADGFATDVLDLTEEEPEQPKPVERAGARVSGATRVSNHKSIGHTLRAAISQMQNCGGDCPQCTAAMKIIDPDGDGDIDLGGYDDSDGDWQSLYNGKQEDMERVVTELIERSLQPVYARFQGIAGTLARNNALPTNIDSLISSSISRAFEAIDAKLTALPTEASLAEVRAELSAVKERVVQIAEQPMPGGPILNAGVMPRAIEKQLPTDPPYAPPRPSMGSVYDAIATMSRQGQLDTEDKQVDAMYAGLLAQRRR